MLFGLLVFFAGVLLALFAATNRKYRAGSVQAIQAGM
jgi:hypothetical protein